MPRVNFSDPSVLGSYASAVREVLLDWLSPERAELVLSAPADSELRAGQPLIRALRKLDAGPTELSGRSTGEIAELVSLAVTGYVITRAATLPGSDAFFENLKSVAAAGRFERFLDALWEAEAAIHFHDGSDDLTARLGESAHPDIWIEVHSGGRVAEHPCECKRIGSSEPTHREQDQFAVALEKWIGESGLPPMKVLIHLRDRPSESLSDAIIETLRVLAADRDACASSWLTGSVAGGLAQVTIQLLGDLAAMQRRPVNIDDVGATGSLICRAETVYEGGERDPVAFLSLLRVRTDLLPRAIGAFERNLVKALRQLERSTHGGGAGIVAIRIRPPRGLGDIFEADRIVRRVLQEQGVPHVGFVMLGWNEAEEERRELEAPGARIRSLQYHLRAHYITNPHASPSFTNLDSARARFGQIPDRVIRDPGSGQLVPADREFLEDPELGSEVPSDEDRFTLYAELDAPYASDRVGPFPRYFRRGEKRLAMFFQPDCEIQFLEFAGGELSRVATIDMRAWIGNEKLLFWVHWADDGLEVAMPLPASDLRLEARAAAVPPVFI